MNDPMSGFSWCVLAGVIVTPVYYGWRRWLSHEEIMADKTPQENIGYGSTTESDGEDEDAL